MQVLDKAKRSLIAFGCAILLIACGDSADSNLGTDSSTTALSQDAFPVCLKERTGEPNNGVVIQAPFNATVNSNDASLIGEVVSVTESQYNSADGKAWCDPNDPALFRPGEKIAETRLFHMRFSVREVIFDSPALPVLPNQELELVYPGPVGSEASIRVGSQFVPRDEAAAPYAVGSQILVMLVNKPVSYKEGPKTQPVVEDGAFNQWKISESQAVSRIPGRSASLSELKSRIRDERRIGGRQLSPEEAERTVINPLG